MLGARPPRSRSAPGRVEPPIELTAEGLWSEVSGRLRGALNETTYRTWFNHVEGLELNDDEFVHAVPNDFTRDWIEGHFVGLLSAAVGDATGRERRIQLRVTEANGEQAEPVEVHRREQTGAGLNPKYTFDSFVIGSSNRFAHAAALAVAEAPAQAYNPLFIYGGVGLGKTHLMHAVGHYIVQQARSLKLTYVSSERFMNEMINALRYERILDFRERYRNVDVLLVDDIQFIGGKESTQTEFFHTFNALFDSAKQIVISSDAPPHEITALEERLRSRFEWGLIADIQPPDLETKVAILRKKAEAEAVPLPDNVAIYIAGKIRSNVRELEGSLIRLVAYASMTGAEINLALAKHVLRNVLSNDERVVTIEIIQKFVADYFQLRSNELKSRNNSKSIALPRQVAMYMCKALTRASLPEIGKAFGGKHHSTVIHSIQKIEGMRQRDAEFSAQIQNLLANFQ